MRLRNSRVSAGAGDRDAAAMIPTGPSEQQDDDDGLFARQSAALIPATVHMISGCHTEETSADVAGDAWTRRPGGACTSALLNILWAEKAHRHQKRRQQQEETPKGDGSVLTYQQLLVRLRENLAKSGFDQVPQLTSSRPLDCGETPFELQQGGGSGGGTKRALLVGINYRNQRGQLRGCVNDVRNMKRYLVEAAGFDEHHILVLVDELNNNSSDPASSQHQHHQPTRQTIIAALRRLVRHSQAG